MNDEIDKILNTLGKDSTPEHRLALKIAMLWIDAIGSDDLEWMEAHIEEMKHLEGVQPNLGRLQKLYDWSNANRPKSKQ